MKQGRYQVLILPSAPGKTRRFSISKKALWFVPLLVVLFLVGDVVAIWQYRKNDQIVKENTSLKVKNEDLEKASKIIEEIKDDEAFVREFLGLGESNPGVGGLGQGGGSSIAEQMSFSPPVRDTGPAFLPEDRGRLVERAAALQENYRYLIEELKGRKEKWDTRPTIMPVKTDKFWISSGFGWRVSPFTGLRDFHSGIDISGRRGTPIIAPAAGVVKTTGKDRLLGRYVTIEHNRRFSTLYGHLEKCTVKKNQEVERGEAIGHMGNSGMSTGYHLHYEIVDNGKKVNPYTYILDRRQPNLLAKR